MPANATDWPAELASFLAALRPGDQPTHYRGEVDATARQLFAFNEFESRSRHRYVRFRAPETGAVLVAQMNTLIGLGAPSRSEGGEIARVRVSLHSVRPDPNAAG